MTVCKWKCRAVFTLQSRKRFSLIAVNVWALSQDAVTGIPFLAIHICFKVYILTRAGYLPYLHYSSFDEILAVLSDICNGRECSWPCRVILTEYLDTSEELTALPVRFFLNCPGLLKIYLSYLEAFLVNWYQAIAVVEDPAVSRFSSARTGFVRGNVYASKRHPLFRLYLFL